MTPTKIKIVLFILILIICIGLRFYHLGQLPPGLNADEASLGYDAYSILLTGKDQYGEFFPVFLRSFGAYQSPLYAYLTTIPIFLFGLTIFSARFLSALVGILTVLFTFLIILEYKKDAFWEALLAAFVISIAPWSIFFSRTAVEANLGLFFVVSATYFLIRSLQKPSYYIFASIILGISTYAYQAQRLGSVLFLSIFTIIFAKQFLSKRKIVFVGLVLLFFIQIPQLILINTEAGTRRLNQVNYFNEDYFNQNGGDLKSIPLGHQIYILNEFLSHYLAYFSPKNLFFYPDPQELRSVPDLSVFYHWMIIPFLFGIKVLWEKRKEPLIKTMILLTTISAVPAALTREPFYTLRVLPVFWGLSIMIAFGGIRILCKIRKKILRLLLLFLASMLSFLALYNSYFILLKYERSLEYGFPYIELAKKSAELNSEKFFVDSGRQSQYYIWFAFFRKYDPVKLQEQGKAVLKDYYNASDFDGSRIIDNVAIRPIDWGKDPCVNQIIVGDDLAISKAQIEEHSLTFKFGIPDLTGQFKLKAYSTDPGKACR